MFGKFGDPLTTHYSPFTICTIANLPNAQMPGKFGNPLTTHYSQLTFTTHHSQKINAPGETDAFSDN